MKPSYNTLLMNYCPPITSLTYYPFSVTELRAIVNNAGVMIFGEFPWQTETQIHRQIAVNLTGAIDVTRIYAEEIIKQNGKSKRQTQLITKFPHTSVHCCVNLARVINICSHCSLAALPGLSVYAASKTGLLAWSDALRIEFKKFNIPVISFIPGTVHIHLVVPLTRNLFTR